MDGNAVVHSVDKLQFLDFVYKGNAVWKQHKNVPFLTWPDGMPCNQANLYLIGLIDENFSLTGRGGTVRQYAYVLSRYIKFCAANQTNLLDITEPLFKLFVRSLKTSNSNKAVQDNTIAANGKCILDFLASFDKLLGSNVVTERLGAKRKIKKVKLHGRTYEMEVWFHSSLPNPSPRRTRSAIEEGAIDALVAAADQSSTDEFVVSRRKLLIKVLETLGARIGEHEPITVEDVRAAREKGTITITTLKRGGHLTREIPILEQDLVELEQFLIERKIALKRAKKKDSGHLFISLRTGRPLSAASLSNEVLLLRRIAGISEKASAHLFRHRFITKLLIYLIEAQELHSAESLRKAMHEIEGLKLILMEWTGQKSMASLDGYIDFAFSEWKNMNKTVDRALKNRARDALLRTIAQMSAKVGVSMSHEEFHEAVKALQGAHERDAESSFKRRPAH